MFSKLTKGEKIARTKTKKSIEGNIRKVELSKQFIKDYINEYMIYHDIMIRINHQLANISKMDNLYMELLKEKRQISKEMRNILDFLDRFKIDNELSSSVEKDEIKL